MANEQVNPVFRDILNKVSKAKQGHTPGPWSVDEQGVITASGPDILETICTTPLMFIIGRIASGETTPGTLAWLGRWEARARANARLIQAAPDLLEALRDMLRILEAHVPKMKNYDGNWSVNAARAVIAKVEENHD